MDRVAYLRSEIIKAKQAYYFGSKPVMTDAAYDALEKELGELSPGDSVLAMVGCPVPPDHILEPAEHKIHMGSQDKCVSIDEFKKWYGDRARNGKVHVSLKLDGSSIAAYYQDGNLAKGITRGNGMIGQDVSANVAKFKELPAYVEVSGELSIRFEGMLTLADWAIVGGKNARNQGNGIINRGDSTQSEFITAYAFDVVSDQVEFKTVTEKFEFLKSIGANVAPYKTCSTPDEVVEFFNETMKNRDSLPITIDGIVIQVDDLAVQDEIGLAPSGKYHKAQIAWKPESQEAVTMLLDVVLTGGHNGGIYPNARLEPVDVCGVTISRALLNNWEEIERLGIAVGDRVVVSRRNDVIPKLERVAEKVYTCPECGFKGSLEEQEKHHT